jgi:hypothetical protein
MSTRGKVYLEIVMTTIVNILLTGDGLRNHFVYLKKKRLEKKGW